MGQYYVGVALNAEKNKIIAHVESWDYGSGSKLMEHSYLGNKFVNAFENLIYNNPMPVVWAGDYADPEQDTEDNLFSLTDKKTHYKPSSPLSTKKSKYIINHDTKQYVDKTKVIDNNGWTLHPLSLLTADGNGRGGGDFRGDSELVGSWARNLISVSEEFPEGYEELIFDLAE